MCASRWPGVIYGAIIRASHLFYKGRLVQAIDGPEMIRIITYFRACKYKYTVTGEIGKSSEFLLIQ